MAKKSNKGKAGKKSGKNPSSKASNIKTAGSVEATGKKVKTEIKAKPVSKKSATTSNPASFVFSRENYMLMFAGLALIILGFILMTGSSNTDPEVFNEDIYSFRRITLAPILIIIGFIVEIVAIMRRPRKA